MNIIYAVVLFITAIICILAGITRIGVWQIERSHPPVGAFKTVNNTKMHYLHVKAGPEADLPPIVFIHGATGNLLDQRVVYERLLKGRGDLIFVDRPGHGYSSRGPNSNAEPDGQAATIAALLDTLDIEKAIIAGHSFGGVVTASFALNHPEKTLGSVFMAPVSHPWPGGVSWYYNLTSTPIIGRLFSETLSLPAGLSRLESGTACVFAPNKPADNYASTTAVSLALRPSHFRSNAIDVAGLFDYVEKTNARYSEIKTPAVIITGDKDTVVLPSIHSRGLKNDLKNSELIIIPNLGHKPDHVVPELAVAAIEKLSGKKIDLEPIAKLSIERIAQDNFGPIDMCLEDGSFIAKEIRAGGINVLQKPEFTKSE